MEEIHADILNEKTGLIVHGVNCRGKMGAGIALKLRNLYPKTYYDYLDFCNRHERPSALLGKVIFTKINDELIIANAFTQLNYGTHGIRYVSYDAIDSCFNIINQYAYKNNLIIKYPRIGVGLGGGNWNIISTIIESNINDNVRHINFINI